MCLLASCMSLEKFLSRTHFIVFTLKVKSLKLNLTSEKNRRILQYVKHQSKLIISVFSTHKKESRPVL